MRNLSTRGERILVVEDEEPIRDLVTTALRFTGFVVETAASGPERGLLWPGTTPGTSSCST